MHTALTHIAAEAFKAFVARAELQLADFPAGLHQVRGHNPTRPRLGSNGAGKTSFFADAPTWCLYGRTAEGLRTGDIHSWLTRDPPRAEVALRRGKQEHTVVRGPKATALTIDGRAVGQGDVDALVGLSYDAWCQAVVWGQGQPLFFDLSPPVKMDLLSDVLGLERWVRRAQAAGERGRRLEARARAAEGEARGLDESREHAQKALETARDAVKSWVGGHTARSAAAEAAAGAASAAARRTEEKRGERAIEADRAGLAARDQREVVAARRQNAADHRRAADRAAAQVEQASSWLAEAKTQAGALKQAGKCPACGQPIKAATIQGHHAELAARLAKSRKELDGARRSASSLVTAADALERRLKIEERKLTTLEEAERRADGDLRLLDRELGSAQAQASAAARVLAQVQAEENPHRQAAQDARTRLREVEHKQKELGKLLPKLEASVERAQFWARGFRDIRLGIIDDVLDDLRVTTINVLEGLGLGDWGLEYVTERETKSGTTQRALAVMVRAPGAPEGVRWESYSGGERQRLRLAGALALSDVLLAHAGVSIDFRVLDEPTRGLSPEGVCDLAETLSEYAKATGLKIFMIDHMAIESTAFTSSTVIESSEVGSVIKA